MTDNAKTAPKTEKTKKVGVPRVAPVLTGVIATAPVARPVSQRGGGSIYPFNELKEPVRDAEGNVTALFSFGAKNKTTKDLAQAVANHNKRNKDENGNATKRFFALDVDASQDPEGASVRVYREI